MRPPFVGYMATTDVTGDSDQPRRTIDWGENTPARYAEYGRERIGVGAHVIGGSCAPGSRPSGLSVPSSRAELVQRSVAVGEGHIALQV